MRIVAVIAAYNESKTVTRVVREVLRFVDRVVIVDDGSDDGTAGCVISLKNQRVVLLKHPKNQGQGVSLRDGINFAARWNPQAIVTYDADDQFKAAEIPELVAPVVNNEADIAIGSRFLGKKSQIPLLRLVILRAGVIFIRLITGVKVSDAYIGLRALGPAAYRKIRITLPRTSHCSEVIDEIGTHKLILREIPVVVDYSDYKTRIQSSKITGVRNLQSFQFAGEHLIYKVRKTPVLAMLILLALGLAVLYARFRLNSDFFAIPDSATYADVARNLLSGKGFVSNSTAPLFYTAWPWRPYVPPLFPLLIAVSFKLFGVSDLAAAGATMLIFVLSIPVLFIFTVRVANGKRAFWAGLWWIVFPPATYYAVMGMAEPLFTFLIILAAYLAIIKPKESLGTGVVLGLAFLTKFQGGLFLLAVLPFVKGRGGVVVGFIAIFLLGKYLFPVHAPGYLLATIAQNAVVFVYPAISLTKLPSSIPISSLVRKVFSGAYNLPSIFLAPIATMFVLSLNKHRLTKELLLALGLFGSFQLLTIADVRYLYPLFPLVLMVVALNTPQRLIVPVTAIMTVAAAYFPGAWTSALRSLTSGPQLSTAATVAANLAKELPRDAVVVSNAAQHIAWYTKRKTIILPQTPADLPEATTAVLLVSHPDQAGLPAPWQALLDEPQVFGKFKPSKSTHLEAGQTYYHLPVVATLYILGP